MRPFKVYDCFRFFNELEILDIRLHELSKAVDYFVLIEGILTHSGNPKRLYYGENRHLFREFNDRIIHVIVRDYPRTGSPHMKEVAEWGSFHKGLDNCRPDDAIMVSDVDEIPRGDDVLGSIPPDGVVGFYMQRYRYHLNRIGMNGIYEDLHPKMALRKNLGDLKDIHNLRRAKCDRIGGVGWHFGFMGGPEKVLYKLQSWGHCNDYYHGQTLEYIGKQIDGNGDVYKPLTWTPVPLDNSFPEYVTQNKGRFQHMIA